jgi:AcrR family transcriptional regulator
MNRREEILSAVLEIFKSKGISSDFTMTELASKLDIGKSTIYEYFKTKEEILTNAVVYMIDLVTKSILERTEINDLPFEESLKSELSYLFDVAQSSHLLMSGISSQIKFTMSDSCKDELRERMNNVNVFYTSKFNNIFIKGIKEGVVPDKLDKYDEALITSIVAGSIVRISNKLLSDNNELDLDKYIDKTYEAIVLILNNN